MVPSRSSLPPPLFSQAPARRRRRRTALLGAIGLSLAGLSLAAEARADWPPPPTLPDPPAGATCVLIRRGNVGAVADADVSLGNGNWATGAYPYTWTGPSPFDHWSLYKFDLSVVPAGSQVVLAAFSTYVSWNDQSSLVRIHRITAPWEESQVTWQNFGGNASWDPAVVASFDGSGVGHKTVDVTPLVQAWYVGAAPNHGLLMEEDPVKLHAYFASESGTVNLRPSLYVCFVAGGPCAGLPEGAGCNDGNLCTTGETCQLGQCSGGAPVGCTAVDQCHEAGVCDPATGQCTTPEKLDGAPCNDADLCTAGDMCQSGMCVGSTPVSCFDGSACTNEVCDPQVGCVTSTVSCDDGNACTADGCDAGTGCIHETVICDDGDACTADTCDPATGCGISPVSCDDGEVCTTDGCDAQTGCFHTGVVCNDSDLCTTDACVLGTGCVYTAMTCNDGDACTEDSCDPAVGCQTSPVSCDDALACTYDSCGGGNCQHMIQCPPGQPCSQDFCSTPEGQTGANAWLCANGGQP